MQLTVVLKHLARHRPNWQITVRCGRGKHTALRGLCHAVQHDQEPEPKPSDYDTIARLNWEENYNCYSDRPNSKITNCLAGVFQLGWDADLGRYSILLTPATILKCEAYLRSIGATRSEGGKFNVVVMHSAGNTSQRKKNLQTWQAQAIADYALQAGRVPLVLDWDKRVPFPDDQRIFCPRPGKGDLWGEFGSGDAETIAALVHLSEAFVGIDSGPGKCASATETPSLHCWMGHHPIQFHDPHPMTTHLVPTKWREIPPAQHNGVAAWFEAHYQFRTYEGEHGLVFEACRWLVEVLACGAAKMNVPFVVPGGIGDTVWALHKIRAIAGDEPIDIILAGDGTREINRRTLPFLKRFPFVRSAQVLDIPILLDKEKTNDDKGRYRYVEDGKRAGYHFLMPNAALERGERLENWLPDVPIDWGVVREFDWTNTETGVRLAEALTPFVVFYLGPERGNVDEGHNRGFQWEPKHWVQLGKWFTERGLRVAVVGAAYDRSFWERYVEAGVRESGLRWWEFFGKLEIGETLALIRGAKLCVSYQSGIGIMAHYFGVPTIMWWRAEGDSAHSKRLVSFDERMATGWTNPAYADRYLGCIYKRESVEEIIKVIEAKGWLSPTT